MALYTNIETFQRDFAPAGAGETYPRLIQRSAQFAYDYINSRLSASYPVPFSPVPGAITDISDMLPKCVLMKLQAGRVPMLPKKVKRDGPMDECSLAISWLDDIAIGRADLPGTASLPGTDGLHTRDGYTPVFDMDGQISQQPDPDLIDKIERERE
jgi:hypothetical protein